MVPGKEERREEWREGGRELSSLQLCVQGMGQTTGVLELRGPQSESCSGAMEPWG